MKAVILAGGKGTRLQEETVTKPKPLVEAGQKPLIWHVMQNFARFGIEEFIILVGYKGQFIREYFANFWLHQSDITFDLSSPEISVHNVRGVPWKVSVIDTGEETLTGGRLLRVADLLKDDFLMTYGDGVSDVEIIKLIDQHQRSGAVATLTAVKPPPRFGAVEIEGKKVKYFSEKTFSTEVWVNGGFFVLSPSVFSYIKNDSTSFEIDSLPQIAKDGLLNAYKHEGFWQPVDTIKDLQKLEDGIKEGKLPWVVV